MNWELAEAGTPEGRFEIFNNVRTFEYARAMGIRGLKDCTCPCIADLACDSGPYVCVLESDDCIAEEDIQQIGCSNGRVIPVTADALGAPWWSEFEPASYDFAGIYSLGVTGFDSTLNRQATPNALGGQSFGPRVNGGRCLTFDVLLLAISEGGLEYSLAYIDNLFNNLDDCGFFTLYMASECPPEGLTDAEQGQYLRHLRRATMASGPRIIETHKAGCCTGGRSCGGGCVPIAARAQFTICMETEKIFTEPEFVCKDELLDKETCTCENRQIIPIEDQVPPLYGTRSILRPRKRYPIQIAKDGSVCRIGDWDWSETQCAGGTGVVVLDSYVESQQTTLEAITETTGTASQNKDCPECQVALYWDADETNPDGLHLTFETLRWTHSGELPCHCDIEVATIYVRDDSYDPAEPIDDGNAPWKAINNSSSSDDCCYIELGFTSPTGGVWDSTGSFGKEPWNTDPGYNPLTGEQNFPPVGCGLRIKQTCEDKDFDLSTYVAGLQPGYLEVEVVGPVTYYSDGSWESSDGQSGCLPESFCADTHVVTTVPTITSGGLNELEFYVGPPGSECPYVGVLGPVTYNDDGTWTSYDGIEGCLPTTPSYLCDKEKMIPYVTNTEEIGSCRGNEECAIQLNTADDTWSPEDWFFNSVDAFPDANCNYSLAKSQLEDQVYVDEEYLIDGGTCGAVDDSGLEQIFPTFASDCWQPVLIPSATQLGVNSCFCLPLERVQACKTWTNGSAAYEAVGNIEIRTGGQDLKNMRIRAWNSTFDSLPSPCEDCAFWQNTRPDFTLEIPHIPGGSTLSVDAETRRSVLLYPGGRSEPAVRYITGSCGEPLDYLRVRPCDTTYIMVEAGCQDFAENLELDISFSNCYGASGGFLLSSAGI